MKLRSNIAPLGNNIVSELFKKGGQNQITHFTNVRNPEHSRKMKMSIICPIFKKINLINKKNHREISSWTLLLIPDMIEIKRTYPIYQ